MARLLPLSRPCATPRRSSASPALSALSANGQRDSQPYRNPGIDYQQLGIDRAAARWPSILKQNCWLTDSM